MKKTIALLLAGLALSAAAKDRIEQNEAPEISHFPPGVAYVGQPIPIYAEVTDKTGKVRKVSVSYALSQQQVPVEVPMKKVSGNRYSGLIPSNFFSGHSKVWYFVSATDSFDERQDTTWYPVLIKNPDSEKSQPDQASAEQAPAQAGSAASAGSPGREPPAEAKLVADTDRDGVGAGTVLVGLVLLGGGGAAVALASDSGGDEGGGGGFDPSTAKGVVRSASGSSSRETAIDLSAAAGGKTVTGVRVTINYDAKGTPDRFQAIYEGRVIADSGVVTGAGQVQGSGSGRSTVCTIQVQVGGSAGVVFAGSTGHSHSPVPTPTPKPSAPSATWSWNANVEVSTQ